MIIEAFAQYLKEVDPEVPATCALARWLWQKLNNPPESNVDRVLHCEIKIVHADRSSKHSLRLAASEDGPCYVFNSSSDSGLKLLQSLYHYALSYEQQKWARWVHWVKASDFNEGLRGC